MKKNLIYVIISIVLYFSLKNFIPYWNYFIYPIDLFTTFLHEFGHGFFSIISGWTLHTLDINSDTSWVATTSGWVPWMIVSGWYIGSALFGALLLFSWANLKKYNNHLTLVLIALLFTSSFLWFADWTSTLIQLWMAWTILFLYKYCRDYLWVIYQIFGSLSLCHIIQDFNVWPTSDLKNFSWILPATIWMYIWLLIVVLIFVFTIKITYFNFNKKTY